jgi:preprotein translocase subunit SecG
MGFTIITIIHILACIFLVLVVLLQTGKGADMGAVFGGSSSTVFGSSGAGNFLTKLTTATAIIFMLTSLGLTYFSSRSNSATVFDSAPATAPAESAPAPAEPAAAEPMAPAAPDAQPVEPAGN